MTGEVGGFPKLPLIPTMQLEHDAAGVRKTRREPLPTRGLSGSPAWPMLSACRSLTMIHITKDWKACSHLTEAGGMCEGRRAAKEGLEKDKCVLHLEVKDPLSFSFTCPLQEP